MHPTKHGSSREMNPSVDAAFRDTSSMVESSTKGADLKTQRSYIHRGVAQLSRFSNSVAVRGSSQLDCSGSVSSINGNWPVDRLGARYNNPDDSSHHLLARQNLPCKEDQHPGLDHKTVRMKPFFQFPFFYTHHLLIALRPNNATPMTWYHLLT